MQQLIIQPCGSKGSKNHYAQTVAAGVRLSEIAEFLSEAELTDLQALYGSNKISVWGILDKKLNQNKWEKIQVGDVATFSQNKVLFSAARVLYKMKNTKLAEKISGTDENGKTWSYLYFLSDVVDVTMPYAVFNEKAGYAPNYVMQSLMVLPAQKAAPIIAALTADTGAMLEMPRV